MMIDFTLDAGRNEGKTPHEAIHPACLMQFRPIVRNAGQEGAEQGSPAS